MTSHSEHIQTISGRHADTDAWITQQGETSSLNLYLGCWKIHCLVQGIESVVHITHYISISSLILLILCHSLFSSHSFVTFLHAAYVFCQYAECRCLTC